MYIYIYLQPIYSTDGHNRTLTKSKLISILENKITRNINLKEQRDRATA